MGVQTAPGNFGVVFAVLVGQENVATAEHVDSRPGTQLSTGTGGARRRVATTSGGSTRPCQSEVLPPTLHRRTRPGHDATARVSRAPSFQCSYVQHLNTHVTRPELDSTNSLEIIRFISGCTSHVPAPFYETSEYNEMRKPDYCMTQAK